MQAFSLSGHPCHVHPFVDNDTSPTIGTLDVLDITWPSSRQRSSDSLYIQPKFLGNPINMLMMTLI